MKQLFSISEMSKIVDIPINTLKYYDRIDLFNPAVVKSKSLYRYYTLEQIYTLVLIKDLRSLNMSIQNIRDYLDNRNVSKSLGILETKLKDIETELETLQKMKSNLHSKISMLKVNNSMRYELNEIHEKQLPQRVAVSYGVCIKNDDDKYFASRQLEKYITGTLPGIICCTHGVFIPKEELEVKELLGSAIAFAFVTSEESENYRDVLRRVPAGKYVCGYYEGKMWDRSDCLRKLLDYTKKAGFHISGDALQINHIDDNLTDYVHEFLYEIQIPVEESLPAKQ